jgi:hypothetical protein
MKTLIIILAVLTILLLLSTVICGLWIRNMGSLVEKSSLDFHLGIGLASVGSALLTIILAVSQIQKTRA